MFYIRISTSKVPQLGGRERKRHSQLSVTSTSDIKVSVLLVSHKS